MHWLLDPAVISFGIASLSLAILLAVSFGVGVRYQIAFDRLPAAARYEELEVMIGAREARLQELTEQLRRSEVNLAEREKAELEAEYWRAAAETAKAEYAALSEQRREIEDVREEYRQALEDLTIVENQLREKNSAAADADAKVAAAEERLNDVALQEKKLSEQQAELRELVEELGNRLSALKQEKAEVSIDVERARERRQALNLQSDELEAAVARLAKEKVEAQDALDEAKDALGKLEPLKAEFDQVEIELASLNARLDEKEETEGRLLARIERLREELGEIGGSGAGTQADDNPLADLTKPPACLAREIGEGQFDIVLPSKMSAEQEADALHRVMSHLQESGFEFPKRTVDAFHTCLKTAVVSPLTVLAGISGTGKSQLPRYYADAMGVHFLKVPVQPRWDGPQDLFGFYNYIEKKYKATDLARALVHLDGENWADLAGDYKDRMLLVLLDEMNLARVEYYFSEFLSRLEGRPFDESAMSADERRPSEIDIDVSHAGQGKRVYVGQNVLFVGTMNEDESTLSLSDKVLDRANVLRFPKPVKLEETLPSSDRKYIAEGYLPKARWTRSWVRSADTLDSAQHKRASMIIGKINEVMNELGRPFGHRMGQAMLHYVANYPGMAGRTNNMDQVNFALGDQIEQRILPRLRGLVAEEHSRPLRDLADIASGELQDGMLAKEINDSVLRSRESNGLFVWRGFTRQS